MPSPVISPAQRRAIKASRRIEKNLYRVGTSALKDIRRGLEDARVRTIAKLADLPPGVSWSRSQQEQVLSELERQLALWVTDARGRLSMSLTSAQDAGIDAALGALNAGSSTVAAQPSISTAFVQAAYENSAVLIQKIGADTLASVDRSLRMGALAQASPVDVMKEIGKVVDRGPFASALSRAETIVRTEMGRVFGTANQATLSDAAQSVPGMKKQWIAEVDDRTREDHIDADGQIVGWDEPFIVGGEELDYPGDPAGSAEQTINCRCVSVPYMDEWQGPSPDEGQPDAPPTEDQPIEEPPEPPRDWENAVDTGESVLGDEYADVIEAIRSNEDEARAISDYTGSDFRWINGHLRDGLNPMVKDSPSWAAEEKRIEGQVAGLDKALARQPLMQDTIVYRNTQLTYDTYVPVGEDAAGKMMYGEIPKPVFGVADISQAIGQVFEDRGFMSTSIDGRTFSSRVNSIRMKIIAPRGTPALWADPVSRMQGEREMLLGRGLRYVVESATDQSTVDRFGTKLTKWEVTVRILP